MNHKYQNLFSPIKIGNVVLKNRIMGAPTGLMSLSPLGHLTTENIAYYELKAKGGCAVVTLGESIVDRKTGESHNRQIRLDDPDILPCLANTVKAIKRHGALANIELSHSGKYAGLTSIAGEITGDKLSFGPSEEVLETGEIVREMDQEMIRYIIEAYGKAAAVVKRAGFDMLMIHAGHGWLFSQFLSPLQNRRTDEFGGSLENRARFLMMVIERVRQAVGPGFPIELRMNGDDFRAGGLTLTDYIAVAKMVDGKVDLINVSCGDHEDLVLFTRTHPSMFLEHGCNVYLAEAVKKEVKTPVSCVGGLNDPKQCEEIIASGKADLVEMARALIADPFLPKKAQEGKEDDITPCLRCFECLGESIRNETILCTVNPVIGNELDHKFYIPKTDKLKKILIAGGGPAGMQAAIEASARGHEVILCEMTDSLGGALKFAEFIPFKSDLHRFSKCLEQRVFNSSTKVMLNTEVDQKLVDQIKPDVIIAAIGADPITPPIKGIQSEKVIFASEAEKPGSIKGDRIVILGGGLVGCETAVHLGQQGKEVTIIEMRDRLAPEANIFHQAAVEAEIKKHVKIAVNTTGKEITDEGILCSDGTGIEVFYPADTIICSAGMRARTEFVDSLRNLATEFYWIGDCVRPRQVTQAVSEGFNLARFL